MAESRKRKPLEHLSPVNIFRFRWEAEEAAEINNHCSVRRITITWEQPDDR